MWVLRCQGVQECPRWLESSFEDAQFCSEMAHAVGFVISARFVPLWEQHPWPSGAVCSCEGLSHQKVSEAAFTSILILNFPFQLSLPDCFLKYRCGFTAWSRSGSAVWQEAFKTCHLFCAGGFPGIGVWGSRASLRQRLICSFCDACVSDFKRAW